MIWGCLIALALLCVGLDRWQHLSRRTQRRLCFYGPAWLSAGCCLVLTGLVVVLLSLPLRQWREEFQVWERQKTTLHNLEIACQETTRVSLNYNYQMQRSWDALRQVQQEVGQSATAVKSLADQLQRGLAHGEDAR